MTTPGAFSTGSSPTISPRSTPAEPRFAALLTPQGKIIVDFIVAEAPAEDGGGFFLDCPRALAPTLVEKLNFYKLRAKVIGEDLSEVLGVMAIWDGAGDERIWSVLSRSAPARRSARASCCRRILRRKRPPNSARHWSMPPPTRRTASRSACRAAAIDFIYGDAFPHEADMDQLAGVDFDKGCYVGQEVVSRVEHRASARSRVVPIAYDEFAPTQVCRSRRAASRSARSARPPTAAASRCCGSIASRMRLQAARGHSKPEVSPFAL